MDIRAVWELELTAVSSMVAPPPAKTQSLGAGPPDQTVNFASANANVAEHTVVQPREFRVGAAGARLRSDRRSGSRERRE